MLISGEWLLSGFSAVFVGQDSETKELAQVILRENYDTAEWELAEQNSG